MLRCVVIRVQVYPRVPLGSSILPHLDFMDKIIVVVVGLASLKPKDSNGKRIAALAGAVVPSRYADGMTFLDCVSLTDQLPANV